MLFWAFYSQLRGIAIPCVASLVSIIYRLPQMLSMHRCVPAGGKHGNFVMLLRHGALIAIHPAKQGLNTSDQLGDDVVE